MNLTGKLFKVNIVVYRGNDISKVVIEDSNGFKTAVNRCDWDCLKLIHHTAATTPGQPRVVN